MVGYRARQLAAIRDAVAAAREALRRNGTDDPLVFAKVFVAQDGIQVPGHPDDGTAMRALGEQLLRALASGRCYRPEDPDLQREIDRVHNEVQWVAAQRDDKIVGFFLQLPAQAKRSPAMDALGHHNSGLGPGVFCKGDIVVLQPECDGARFIAVFEDEIEC
ncbi:MAG: hypothetical protein J5I81_02160 [Nitrococcus mobilis]|nr:hypothetical protein [Nitrococcus mobilis]